MKGIGVVLAAAALAVSCSSALGADPPDSSRVSRKEKAEPDRIFYITGEVNHPGEYTFRRGATVLKALEMADGLTKGSDGTIMLLRGSKPMLILMAEAVRDPAKWDLLLKDDDILIVGRYWITPEPKRVKVVGYHEEEHKKIDPNADKSGWSRLVAWWKAERAEQSEQTK